jgi:CelD/BcsL family acetyltransferase involved in cellulose biosynthesis
MGQIALLPTAQPSAPTVTCLNRFEWNQLEREWPALLQRTGHDTPFYQHELIRLWYDTFAPGDKARVVVARDAQGLRGALCLVEQKAHIRGLPVRILRGTCSVWTERFDLIADPADEETIDALWRYVRDQLDWHVLELAEVPVRAPEDREGAAFALLNRAAREAPTGTWVSKHVPRMSLPGSFDALLASRPGPFRNDIKRNARRLGEKGVLTEERVTGGPDLEARLQEGFALEASGWKGAEGTAIACDPRLVSFYTSWAKEAAARGYLSLSFLRLDGRAFGFHYAFERNGTYYLPKLGIDDTFRKNGPGQQHVAVTAKGAIERGCTAYDFLGPAMDWKFAWTPKSREHRWIYIFRDDRYGRLLHSAKLTLPALVRNVQRRLKGLEGLKERFRR